MLSSVYSSGEYELLPRSSESSAGIYEQKDQRHHQGRSVLWWAWQRCCYSFCYCSRRPRRLYWLYRILLLTAYALLFLASLTAVVLPSFTRYPDHYYALKRRCQQTTESGRGNIHSEKVFIALALYDPGSELTAGYWGRSVAKLVDLIGPENVHVSIYENDMGSSTKASIEAFQALLKCNVSVILEPLPIETIAKVRIPSGESLASRIALLAEIRNRVLQPLRSSSVQFDKLLFINDVFFHALDALQLLFSTNIQPSGRTDYGAACAVDFINAFKFYDRFATRDFEGHNIGLQFFPWFTNAGAGISRQDVLAQKDAVRVSSCWGGMTAFEAKWFQGNSTAASLLPAMNTCGDSQRDLIPLQFRFEKELFWEASECCLIHADLACLRHGGDTREGTGIFMNPYIRVAYDMNSFRWLPYVQRLERLFSIPHNLLNHVMGLPEQNPRRLERPGTRVVENVWEYDKHDNTGGGSKLTGFYRENSRVANPGRFCGKRGQMVMRAQYREGRDPREAEDRWMNIPAPP